MADAHERPTWSIISGSIKPEGDMVFEPTHDGKLRFHFKGEVEVFIAPSSRPPESPTTASPEQPNSLVPVDTEIALSDDLAGDTGVSTSRPETQQQKEQKEKTRRYKGRIGSTPIYDTIKSGEPRVRFRFAEHPEDARGHTVWHDVYTTKGYAERIHTDLTAGEEVTVTGMPQVRTVKTRDGRERTKQLIYAFGVKPTGRPSPEKSERDG